jgi:hypothetical protein
MTHEVSRRIDDNARDGGFDDTSEPRLKVR